MDKIFVLMNLSQKKYWTNGQTTRLSTFISDPVPLRAAFLFVLSIVVPGCPARVHLHVDLSFLSCHFIVFCLLLLGKGVPLQETKIGQIINLDHPFCPASFSSFSGRIDSCPGHSNEGTSPCASVALTGLFHSIFAALPGTNCATEKSRHWLCLQTKHTWTKKT